MTLEGTFRLLKMCDDHVAVQGINVFFNFLASFIIGQFFNTMLCSMQVCLQASAPQLSLLSLSTCGSRQHPVPHLHVLPSC